MYEKLVWGKYSKQTFDKLDNCDKYEKCDKYDKCDRYDNVVNMKFSELQALSCSVCKVKY